jgi:hypothetical protein
MYSNDCNNSSLRIIFAKTNLGMFRVAKNMVVTIVTFTNLSYAMSGAVLLILSITFERVVIIDRASMETVEICRRPGFFSKDEITSTEHDCETNIRTSGTMWEHISKT